MMITGLETSGYVKSKDGKWYLESDARQEEYGADFLSLIDEILEFLNEDETKCGDHIKVSIKIEKTKSA